MLPTLGNSLSSVQLGNSQYGYTESIQRSPQKKNTVKWFTQNDLQGKSGDSNWGKSWGELELIRSPKPGQIWQPSAAKQMRGGVMLGASKGDYLNGSGECKWSGAQCKAVHTGRSLLWPPRAANRGSKQTQELARRSPQRSLQPQSYYHTSVRVFVMVLMCQIEICP